MRIIHISDLHFTGGDNDAPVDDWAGFDWSKVNLTDPSTWSNLCPLKPWNADSLNRSTTLSNYLIANKAKLNADAIVITGDLVDSGDDGAAYNRVTSFIELLTGNGFQVYSLPGNHDYSHWGELAWASEDNRKQFHKVPGTSGDESKYPWVVPLGRDTLILLDSLKAELDANHWGATCSHPLGVGDYHMALDASSIAGCLGPDLAAPVATIDIEGGDQLAQGLLGTAQLTALSSALDSLQSQRSIDCKVVVCLHHNPFSTDSNGCLSDSAAFLSTIHGKVDALIFGHATPDANVYYWQDGSAYGPQAPTPTDWEKDNLIPLVSCLNLQHAGPKGYSHAQTAYPIPVVDTYQNQIEVFFTDGTEFTPRKGLMAATIVGLVSDGQVGTPIAGAAINVYVPPDLVPVASATTDANGVYSVGLTAIGSYRVEASSQFYSISDANVTVAWGDVAQENFVLQVTGGTLSGNVTDQSGKPVAGVEIDLCDFYGSATPIASTTTGPMGNYRVLFDYPKIWAIDVYTRSDNYSEGMAQLQTTGQNTVQNFSLLAIAPGTITGHVTDDHGAAVAGAAVSAIGGYYDKNVQTTTDSSGSYSVSLNAGGVNLTVVQPGYESANIQNVTLGAWATVTQDVVLVKRVPGNIAGMVTDPSGQPAAGAEVTADTASDTTGLDGSYTLANVLSGPVSLSATLGAESCTETVTVIGSQTITANLKLVAPPTCTGAGQPSIPCVGAGKPDNPCVGAGKPDNPRPCKGTTVF
jgi:3',5'-cyclic AMP phosphodiesterase CpdA